MPSFSAPASVQYRMARKHAWYQDEIDRFTKAQGRGGWFDGEADEYDEDEESSEDAERRFDSDGKSYTIAQFHAYYGGLDEWNHASPALSSRRGASSPVAVGIASAQRQLLPLDKASWLDAKALNPRTASPPSKAPSDAKVVSRDGVVATKSSPSISSARAAAARSLDISVLPTDILGDIVSLIGTASTMRCMRVCKAWWASIQTLGSVFWTRLIGQNFRTGRRAVQATVFAAEEARDPSLRAMPARFRRWRRATTLLAGAAGRYTMHGRGSGNHSVVGDAMLHQSRPTFMRLVRAHRGGVVLVTAQRDSGIIHVYKGSSGPHSAAFRVFHALRHPRVVGAAICPSHDWLFATWSLADLWIWDLRCDSRCVMAPSLRVSADPGELLGGSGTIRSVSWKSSSDHVQAKPGDTKAATSGETLLVRTANASHYVHVDMCDRKSSECAAQSSKPELKLPEGTILLRPSDEGSWPLSESASAGGPFWVRRSRSISTLGGFAGSYTLTFGLYVCEGAQGGSRAHHRDSGEKQWRLILRAGNEATEHFPSLWINKSKVQNISRQSGEASARRAGADGKAKDGKKCEKDEPLPHLYLVVSYSNGHRVVGFSLGNVPALFRWFAVSMSLSEGCWRVWINGKEVEIKDAWIPFEAQRDSLKKIKNAGYKQRSTASSRLWACGAHSPPACARICSVALTHERVLRSKEVRDLHNAVLGRVAKAQPPQWSARLVESRRKRSRSAGRRRGAAVFKKAWRGSGVVVAANILRDGGVRFERKRIDVDGERARVCAGATSSSVVGKVPEPGVRGGNEYTVTARNPVYVNKELGILVYVANDCACNSLIRCVSLNGLSQRGRGEGSSCYILKQFVLHDTPVKVWCDAYAVYLLTDRKQIVLLSWMSGRPMELVSNVREADCADGTIACLTTRNIDGVELPFVTIYAFGMVCPGASKQEQFSMAGIRWGWPSDAKQDHANTDMQFAARDDNSTDETKAAMALQAKIARRKAERAARQRARVKKERREAKERAKARQSKSHRHQSGNF